MADEIVILCTCGTVEEAEKIALLLIEERLAACVTMVPSTRSYYRWQGAVETAIEQLLLIKSTADLFSSVEQAIGRIHSYQVPELLALPVREGSAAYLDWLRGNLRPNS